MKKCILFSLFLFVSGILHAQTNSGKAVISTPGLHCDIDKNKVEAFLGRMYGVTSVKGDVKKKTVTVTWIPERTDIEQVKTAIANRGYDADDVTAEETMVKRLPPGCRMPVVADTSAKKP